MARRKVADEDSEWGKDGFGGRSGRTRNGAAAAVAGMAIGIVVVVILSGILNASVVSRAASSAAGPCSSSESPRSAPGEASESYGASQVAAAERSLQSGDGPSGHGMTANIAGNGSGSAGTDGACASSPGSTPLTTTTPSWRQVTYPTPVASEFGSMVYDAKDGYVLLFGGYSSSFSYGTTSATWKFSSGVWTQLHPTTSPTPREEAAIAYDAADQYVLLFGGYNETVGALADTWKFVGGAWTELSPATHPAALSTGTMSYDAKDGYVVFFDSTPSTWKFLGGVWTKLSPATQPTSRQFEMMDYDAYDGYVLLFGGYGSSEVLGDTWTFTGGDWTELSPTTSPPARYGGAMAYSAINGEVVLFGGHLGSGMISDTWKFVGGVWTKVSSEANPSKRSYLAAADGTSTASLVVFGGVNASAAYLNDTWTFQGTAWTHVLPREPAARYGDSLAYDQKDGYVLLFGGLSYSNGFDLGDTWTFSYGIWTPHNPAVSPSPRAYASMVYDAADGYVVLFGGLAGRDTDLGDTWTYAGGVWTNITSVSSALAPPSRDSAAMTFDYADGYVVLFGGENVSAGLLFGDTWSFSAGIWSPLSPDSSPTARAGPAMTYDSENGYVLLYGGVQSSSDISYNYADTWSFVGGQWSNLTSILSSEPPAASYGGMADDTYDGYPLMFGGDTSGGDVSTSWEFTGSGWTKLAPALNPGTTDSIGMAFDPLGNYVVLFGGIEVTYQGNTWTY